MTLFKQFAGTSLYFVQRPTISAVDLADAEKRYWAEVSPFIAARKTEFLTGRVLAEQQLANFGVANIKLSVAAQGYPIWPEAFVGSISHDRQCYGVALALKKHQAYLGFDIHFALPLPQIQRIYSRFTATDSLTVQQATAKTSLALCVFLNMLWCAKEAAYKTLPVYMQSSGVSAVSLVHVELICDTTFCFIFNAPASASRQVLVTMLEGYAVAICAENLNDWLYFPPFLKKTAGLNGTN
ncbi:hypothetical protein [Rheinheimera maricola]|uniref:4'-phosphopantetheinyl transferase N-terminal domain-containing protein n=1 Tax=Rheinheimera maricola TaxID=2793282 RepID=A0ABS7X6W4_9GAMM|nr:hypothetical protein [Rheinheimera maricola]MBZ9610337.1 hypothetical protein [Rheinheimera maricola]